MVLSYSYLLTDKLDHFVSSDLAIYYQDDKEDIIKKLESFFNSKNIIIKKIDFSEKQEAKAENDNDTDSENATTKNNPTDVEKNMLVHIKYEHNIKLTSILTAISTIENVLKVEEI